MQNTKLQTSSNVDQQLSSYDAETIDAVVAIAKALHAVRSVGSTKQEGMALIKNSSLVRQTLKNVSFAGVSGSVEFDEAGDRVGSGFSVMNSQGQQGWALMGTAGSSLASVQFDSSKVFNWGGIQRGKSKAKGKRWSPKDSYEGCSRAAARLLQSSF